MTSECISLAIAPTHIRACSWMSLSSAPTDTCMKSTSSSGDMVLASWITREYECSRESNMTHVGAFASNLESTCRVRRAR